MKSVCRSSQAGCRICGKSNGVLVDILEKKSKRYLHQIRKFLLVEISSSDNLPKSVCHSCIATLNDFALLFDKCQAVQQDLNDSVNSKNVLQNQNVSAGEEDRITKTVEQNLNSSIDQSRLLKIIERTDEEKSSDPLSSESSIVIGQREDETETNLSNCHHEDENNSEKPHDIPNPSETPDCNGDWKIQKLPKSDMKLYLCNKCSIIYTCEEAKKSHKCSVIKDELEISEDSLKKPKFESDY